ncbi:histidine phosphatase family protein [Mycolicibacterium sp. 120270]|uniref:histidine phosphatase family protein n=1 Tax=Mycolicibacterium sp. 120270 TaxID=3090600 RepID=UPI00299D4F99|nr:histidine phosphatase family protein [Mycolicibacterium sp. 120270]MDX1884543.1 histidine phosphatase family protein [Mycolicibacterium sp. 120270]
MNDGFESDAIARPRRRRVRWTYVGTALTAFLLLFAAAIPASAAEMMRVTFVRHAESEGNASGKINTQTPGPVLTAKGQQQAQDVVATLGDNNYDAIYASTMVRTQQTAAPMSQYLRLPIQVLPGLQEIEAGVFEDSLEANAASGYGLYPIGWALPGIIPQLPASMFNKSTYMPGTNVNGYVFDERVDNALQTMYDNGDRNPIVFSHGGTIMFWTIMNVNNLTPQQKLELLKTAQLKNTDYVVIEGNPEDGWTLVSWNGQQFAPEPTLGNEVKLQVRTLTRQLSAVANQVAAAFATRDIAAVATAINRGIADASYSAAKFTRAVNAKVIHEVEQAVQAPAPSPVQAPTVASTSQTVTAEAESKNKAPATPKAAVVQSTKVATNGATDLKDGNKAVPGKRDTRSAHPGSRLLDIVKDAGDQLTSAVRKLGDIGPKKSETDGGPSNSGAGDGAGAESDAA